MTCLKMLKSIIVLMIFALLVSCLAVGAQEKPYKGVTVTITSLNAAWADAAISMLPKFEQRTGIKVIWEPLPFDSIHEKQVTDMAAGMGTYDVVSFDNPWLAEFAGSGWLENLDALVEKTDFPINDYPAQLMDYWRFEGNLVALPFQPDCRMIFYRKDLFEQAGFVFTPRYWDEFVVAAEKLNKPDAGVYAWDFSPARTVVALVELLPWIWGNGGDLFDQDMNPTINEPKSVEALDYYVSLKKYAPPGIENRLWDELLNNSLQGLTAMAVQPSVFAGKMDDPELSRVVGKIGYFPVPYPRGGKMSAAIGGWSLAIPWSSTNKEAGWELIQFLASPEIEKEMALTPGSASTPVRISTLSDPEILKMEYISTFLESLRVASYSNRWKIVEWAEIQDYFTLAVQKAVMGDLTPQHAFDELAAKVYEIMKQAGYYN